jgi:dipeptidyl aminopeptidase/acylaminoacyl peptidase
MVVYGRKSLARAAVCATALALPLAVSGCASNAPSGAAAPPAAVTTAPTTPDAPVTPTSVTPTPNGTAGTKLTISDGTSKVLMDGTSVDFGTEVHDLAWSPDGKLAAFIDGSGSLSVANPDGSNRVEVAKNPGGQTWSHPTWQVTPEDPTEGAARDNIFFASTANGVSTLMGVEATAQDGTPKTLSLNAGSGANVPQIPQAGNSWPSAAGKFGSSVYEYDKGSVATVYVRDDYLRQQGEKLIDDAAEPAYFVDDSSSKVVFVRASSGHKHIFAQTTVQTSTSGAANGKPFDLTPSASADLSAPVFSPDGKTVAFATPDQIDVVDIASPGKVTVVSNATGVPAYRP